MNDDLAQSVCTDLSGQTYHWDRWYATAIAAGVPEEVASLGRTLLRDHCQHGREDWVLGEAADGPLMLELAINAPFTALQRFLGDVAHFDGLAGDEVAQARLVELLGSEDAVEQTLDAEKAAAAIAWKRSAI